MNFSRKDEIWVMTSEFFMVVGFVSVGFAIRSHDIFLLMIGMFNSIVWFGTLSLYISKYKLLPFYFKLYPKKIKDWYYKED